MRWLVAAALVVWCGAAAFSSTHRVIVFSAADEDNITLTACVDSLNALIIREHGLSLVEHDSVVAALTENGIDPEQIPGKLILAGIASHFHADVVVTVTLQNDEVSFMAFDPPKDHQFHSFELPAHSDPTSIHNALSAFLMALRSRLPVMNEENVSKKEDDDIVEFFLVEKPPKIKGGVQKLYTYLAKKNLYPDMARRAQIEGDAIIGFVVNHEGVPTEVVVLHERPAGLGFGDAGAKAIKAMKFSPGYQKDKPVSVRMQQVIRFRLQ